MRIVVSVLLALCFATSAFAEVETITGEVIDTFCYATKDARGRDHSECASKCIKAGVPVGILTAEGKLYFPLREDHKPANALFEKLGGVDVKVTGTTYEKNGIKFIVVSTVEKIK